VVDGIEIFAHIHLAEVPAFFGVMERLMGAFLLTAGVRLVDEVAVEIRFGDVDDRMMDDPFPEGRREDGPRFGSRPRFFKKGSTYRICGGQCREK
jgi:hypothetical protein